MGEIARIAKIIIVGTVAIEIDVIVVIATIVGDLEAIVIKIATVAGIGIIVEIAQEIKISGNQLHRQKYYYRQRNPRLSSQNQDGSRLGEWLPLILNNPKIHQHFSHSLLRMSQNHPEKMMSCLFEQINVKDSYVVASKKITKCNAM